MTPSDVPSGAKASKLTVPSPSVHTIPACVGSPSGAPGSKVKVIPVEPLPKYEWPPVPERSIAPSSASTESVIPLGLTSEPLPVTPGVSGPPSSKSSRQKLGPVRSNGESAALR